jgi:uncharacterized protein (DUF2235 family)
VACPQHLLHGRYRFPVPIFKFGAGDLGLRDFSGRGTFLGMSKNIVVCCDGTANEFAHDRTNVIKLYSALVQDTSDQITFYHPGIGTMEPFGALSPLTRAFTRLLGMAVGYGLENDIRDAYNFLIEKYEPGDRIYLFGFSRGAFTVRAVASLILWYGLIRAGNGPLVPYAIRMLMAIQRAKSPTEVQAYFDLARQFRDTMACAKPAIHFVGVWDTVSSVGWVENPLHLPGEADNPSIEIGRHAVSIDEHRAFFRSHLWIPSLDPAKSHGPKDVKQVWFPGVHCDVGGGYEEQDGSISKYALKWIIDEAKAAGLLFEPSKESDILGLTPQSKYAPAKPDATRHESLTGLWNLAEFIPKKHWNYQKKCSEHRMNLYRRRTIPNGSLIHESAYLQGTEYQKRFPPGAVKVPL